MKSKKWQSHQLSPNNIYHNNNQSESEVLSESLRGNRKCSKTSLLEGLKLLVKSDEI
ncbi:MAG: hypothetical protein RBR88_05265 [Candidatus Saccharicenans sp.]|nr:hypothetical protein [Candidatus Saccharicenans sp.]